MENFFRTSALPLLLLFAMTLFSTLLKGQEGCDPDYEECVDLGIPQWPKFCTGNDGSIGYLYSFPQVVGCNGFTATISPADAGIVLGVDCTPSISGCEPKVCVRWLRAGCNDITVRYECGGYIQLRTKTVAVSLSWENVAECNISSVSNCLPNYSFTISRTSPAPVKQHRLIAYILDGTNTPTNPPIWDTGWQNGNFTTRTLTALDGIPFLAGRSYRFRLQTKDVCGEDDFFHPQIFTIQNYQAPVPEFTINGSSNFPVNLFTCNNSPMILYDATTFPGCNPKLVTAEITMAKATNNCSAILANTSYVVTLPYAAGYNLRSLFTGYVDLPGKYFLFYRVQDQFGTWYGFPQHCISINSLDPSNAEFLLKGPNNSPPLQRTSNSAAPNTALGQLSCGLYLNNTTSQVGSLDYYRVEIWRTNATSIVETILNSGNIAINAQNPFPIGYDFNPATNGYFFSLSAANVTNYRFKVRLTVHNQCDETFQESYFRILPGCPFCLTTNAGNLSVYENLNEGNADERYQALSDFHFSVYPNPTDGFLNLKLENATPGESEFSIFDASGKRLVSSTFELDEIESGFDKSVSISHLPSGIYVWKFINNGQVVTGKVAKN